MIIISIILFSFFVFTSGSVIADNFSTVSVKEEEVTTLKDVTEYLKTFLNRNLEALEEFDPSLTGKIKLTNESSIKKDLLQHQMILQQEMKKMFSKMKSLILGHKQTDYAVSQIKKEVIVNDQARNDSEKEKNSTMRNLDPRNQPESDTEPISTDTAIRPSDCSDLLIAGYTESGVYYIYPFICHCTNPVKVFCDMETEGGGWTVFLNRVNVSNRITFCRNWQDYKNGFGIAGEEYWLGNEVLHIITSSRKYMMRMEAQDGFGREVWGEWNSFLVNSEADKYRLDVTSYNEKSTAKDSYSDVANNDFSTFDVDNDHWEGNSCAKKHRGGWWYNTCSDNNPTGEYGKETYEGLVVRPWSKTDETIRYAKMMQFKIRPKVCGDHISAVQLNKHNCA